MEERLRRLVYISHTAQDADVVRLLTTALDRVGIKAVSNGADVRAGERWGVTAERSIGSADAVLVLVSGASMESLWVRREIELAERRAATDGTLLVPIFVRDAAADARLPHSLMTRQGLRLDPGSPASFDKAAWELGRSLGSRVQPDSAATPIPGPTASPRVGAAPALGTAAGLWRRVWSGLRRIGGADADPRRGGADTDRASGSLRDVRAEVVEAFRTAERELEPTDPPELLAPDPVWVSGQVTPTAAELERFADLLPFGRVGYFVHQGELPRDADIALDQMRVGGKPVVTLSLRALRAARADGRVRAFLTELERGYGSQDNLFETKNALVDERLMFGRDVWLNTAGSAIRRDEHILLTGLRKVGKTSLLNVLRQHLADMPVCVVDLQRFDRHHEDWPITLFALITRAVDQWAAAQRLRWPFDEARPATATELEWALERRFDRLGSSGETPRVAVLLDELERVFPGRSEPEAGRRWVRATGALRALAQGERRSVVLVGADLRPVANRRNDLGEAGTNPFFSFFHEMHVPLLDLGAVGEMVESLARAMGVNTVTEAFIDRLFALTGGHPALARSLASEAYLERRRPPRLDVADLESGLARLTDRGTIDFMLRQNFWQMMNPAEQQLLARLAAGVPDKRGGEAHTTLAAQGVVSGDSICVGLLAAWIREREHDG